MIDLPLGPANYHEEAGVPHDCFFVVFVCFLFTRVLLDSSPQGDSVWEEEEELLVSGKRVVRISLLLRGYLVVQSSLRLSAELVVRISLLLSV